MRLSQPSGGAPPHRVVPYLLRRSRMSKPTRTLGRPPAEQRGEGRQESSRRRGEAMRLTWTAQKSGEPAASSAGESCASRSTVGIPPASVMRQSASVQLAASAARAAACCKAPARKTGGEKSDRSGSGGDKVLGVRSVGETVMSSALMGCSRGGRTDCLPCAAACEHAAALAAVTAVGDCLGSRSRPCGNSIRDGACIVWDSALTVSEECGCSAPTECGRNLDSGCSCGISASPNLTSCCGTLYPPGIPDAVLP
eukprot:scaffold18361_cov101-Isochrysis_galbana.AAC.1